MNSLGFCRAAIRSAALLVAGCAIAASPEGGYHLPRDMTSALLDTADFGPTPVPTTEQPNPQPTPVSGTFRLLVFGR